MEQKDIHSINSREWWEDYFARNWDMHGGGDQTRYFMQRLLAELSAPELTFLRSRPLTILDWGCAFGEGVELLSRAFTQSRVVGIDFSSVAVKEARQRHPGREFVSVENGEITSEVDVIVTSNCLEHFEHPFEVINAHLRSCRKLYIVLVPYNEYPLSEYHRSQFKEESFPERIGNFVRLYTRVIDTEPVYWDGQQLLIVYGSQPYLRERAEIETPALEQEKWDKYYSSLPLYEPDKATEACGLELIERISELIPAGSRILEGGCGGGWQSLALARSGKFQVSLMDFSREALQYAKRLFEREQVSAEFIYGDVFTPGEPQFDLVFNAGVLEHYSLDEQAAFLRGMASRSRNYVLALVPNRLCYWYWLWRIQKSASGEWPFGREVPLSNFSEAFHSAGLKFLGQTFMGQEWAESFVVELAKTDQQLCNNLLKINRSPIIPKEQKSYLLAGLGSISLEAPEVSSVWMPSPALEGIHEAELNAALADALALRIGAEQGLSRLQAQVLEKEQSLERSLSELADKERSVRMLSTQAAEGEQRVRTLSAEMAEKDHALSASCERMTGQEQVIQGLSSQLGEKEQELSVLSERITGQEQIIQTLWSQLDEKEQELSALSERITQTLSPQLDEKDQALSDLSTRVIEKDQAILSLSSEVREKQEALNTLSSQLSEAEQTALSLSSQLKMKERSSEALSEQLSVKEYQLRRITNTLGWRLLSRYGRIKYPYLLPFYKVLGLPPYDKRAAGNTQGNQPSWQAQAIQPLPIPSCDDDNYTVTSQVLKTQRSVTYEPSVHDLICFPIIDWDFRFQRPQQLMSRFAAAGHRVFYIAQTFYSSGQPYTIQERRKNIYEVSLRGPGLNVYTDILDERARDALFASLDALRRDLSLGATVSFVQLPFWSPLANKARAQFAWPVVYDCMDHHAGFSTNKQQMVNQERDLLSSADLVVVSSQLLEQQARQHSSNVLLVRNACEYEHFASVVEGKSERPVIGYYGAIAEWFDSNLVSDLAEKRPDWDFVLVGSTFSADVSRISKLPNVTLPGEKHYSEIPDWLGKFDVAIIPFKRTPLTEATNPVKAYEILAAGKPLVSVPIPEVAALAPFVRLASTAQEFEKEIAAALDENEPELIANRRAFAKEHTWQKRYEALAPAVRNVFPKASIIIVTFNNVDLNRLCLESLYARTEWPNFEVIVVDNASSDETPLYLEEVEKTMPDLRVILNNRNLGFAAANNAGLRQATGQYLVLLNNDTVLARGWLSSLIRHLNADPRIGLIGPVTNAIGNEAQIDVGYERVDDMPGWAANYIRENDGRNFAIPMVAMFCVATTRTVINQVGLLDERFGIGMFEDDDYNRRVRDAGYDIRCAHDSFVHHWQKSSFRLLGEKDYLRIFEENRKKFEAKWGEPWKAEGIRVWNRPDLGFYRDQLAAVTRRVQERKGAVIFLPSVGWGIHLFQRPHHLARAFAQQGYVSVFDCSNAHDDVNGFKEIEQDLYLFRGPEKLLREIPNAVLWTFPYNFHSTHDYPKTACTIYDWIDDLEVFPYDRALLENNHARALREATVVSAVARRLHEQALEKRPDAVYLPNGVEDWRFADESIALPIDRDLAEFRRAGKPIAGYYGAIAKWFDYDLVDAVACRRPDWNFLLIGPMYDGSLHGRPMLRRPNVAWIGPRDYESLPGYLRLFDVAMIPFLINDITLATSPLKLFEYFAGGKPVITTPMTECQAFAEVHVVRSAEEFSQALDVARERGREEGYCARLRALGRENSWTTRVQTVEGLFHRKRDVDDKATQPPAPVTAGSATQRKPVHSKQQDLTGAAAEIAERFSHFRTGQNTRFFDALCNHLSSLQFDPCLPLYFEFAITCNERGRRVANLLQKYKKVRGKRYLDIGCAYAGFLVAFAEQGAEVAGVDNDEMLLNLARYNLLDNNLDAPLHMGDATCPDGLSEMQGYFDIITCNDVIEHVDDPQALLRNITALLRDDGIAYFEIPNRYCPHHVLRDGHYNLFGITLLDYPDASRYYSFHAPGVPYTVRHYLEIDEYAKLFEQAGMTFAVMDDTFEKMDIGTILSDIAEVRAQKRIGLKTVPSVLRERVEELLSRYLDDVEATPRATASEQHEFMLRYGVGFWRALGRKTTLKTGGSQQSGHLIVSKHNHNLNSSSFVGQKESARATIARTQECRKHYPFREMRSHPGRCNVCGSDTLFFYTDEALYRESLVCGECLTTSRYRSIARGILRSIRELASVRAGSVAELNSVIETVSLKIYDTQVPFYYETNAYPIPDLLSKCKWIDIETSLYRPQEPFGIKLGANVSNQNLEELTFPDNTFDVVITSDVMEHVRLDERAHREISRVLKPGGIYLFTVPHFRDRHETLVRVKPVDPSDPAKDQFLTEKEYHGDANSEDSRTLSYRSYGTDLDEFLHALGFSVEYCKQDFPQVGIMNTELFYCKLSK